MFKEGKVVVLGGGSFGTAIANIVALNQFNVALWMRSVERADRTAQERVNADYLPHHKLAPHLVVTSDLALALRGATTIFFAVPSSAIGDLAQRIADKVVTGSAIVSTAKGICGDNFDMPSELLSQQIPHARVAVISGPNLAKEIASQQITGTVVASEDPMLCKLVQNMLGSKYFRVYANHDQRGVELAGALKNIYAIIAGVASAMEAGQNTKSVFLTRSLAEMCRFGTHLGANASTFLGLSGVGDLFVTCTSPLSRNFQVGYGIGMGKSLAKTLGEVGQVVEGINTTKLVKNKADQLGIYMPLASALYATLFQDQSIEVSLQNMMRAEQNYDVDFMENLND
ncbi:MAG: glycerol-3-phosphate dehydrogenase [Porticoccaceae bacterium]|nr:glycerol-3-phosphate dehydrogenase [Porticoccaceae bacterium]